MAKRVIVDMDGVLADVYAQYEKYELKDKGIVQPVVDLYGKREEEAFENFEIYVNSKGFFRDAPVMPGSIEGLQYLNDKYEVVIASSAMEFPDSLREKFDWLGEFYPFIKWQQIVFCGRKDIITGNIMIDDHIFNLDHFNGRKIIFTQPHNIFINSRSYIRVNNWDQITTFL